jgi:hypothetical protein
VDLLEEMEFDEQLFLQKMLELLVKSKRVLMFKNEIQ